MKFLQKTWWFKVRVELVDGLPLISFRHGWREATTFDNLLLAFCVAMTIWEVYVVAAYLAPAWLVR